VVGVVIDQMRYDFLFRYWTKYGEGGFKRLLKEGYSFANCNFNYFPTYTGPGHASIYTGTTPAVHGIVGNDWFEKEKSSRIYCTQDDSVKSIGGSEKAGKMSPVNMQSYSIGDQVKLFNNFRGKSFGISLKDRGAILPAGHGADAAFWFDSETGNFISSTWYKKLNGNLPDWLQNFNTQKQAEKFKNSVWNPILPINQYTESTSDLTKYEEGIIKGQAPEFPYDLKKYLGGDFEIIRKTPFGNTITTNAAIELIKGESLGKDEFMDFLAVSYSSTDIVGHAYGPYAIETEDTYLKMDLEIERLLKSLENEVGKDQFLLFLTADHGVLEVPAFLRDNGLPAKSFRASHLENKLKSLAKEDFGDPKLIRYFINDQVYLNDELIKQKGLNRKLIAEKLIELIEKEPTVLRAFDFKGNKPFPEIPNLSIFEAGYFRERSGDIQIVLKPGTLEGKIDRTGTSHGSPYSYDSHIPCLWYGWKILPGEETKKIEIQDIAPTLSTLLHIMEPNGSTGTPRFIPTKK
jgi:predicted AlkP superfamily pyrophosphatase or phosphodiesterase